MKSWKCRACGALLSTLAGNTPRACPTCDFAHLDEVDAKTARPIDPMQGEANKEAALARVEEAADPQWKAKAKEAIRIVARTLPEFTTDEVWKLLPPTRENRVLGALMIAAQKEGTVAWTNRTVKSDRPGCNRRPVRIWRSLIYPRAASG